MKPSRKTGYRLPSDAPLMEELQALADAVVPVFRLPLVRVHHVPHNIDAMGLCYWWQHRVCVRLRDFSGNLYPRGERLDTLAHELAHMRYRNHCARHASLTKEVLEWLM